MPGTTGGVVKTVGDGDLLTTIDVLTRPRSACTCPETWDTEERPPLGVGAAYGAVLFRLGDVYSPVVNLASRLTSLACPRRGAGRPRVADRLRDKAETGSGRSGASRCAATTTSQPGLRRREKARPARPTREDPSDDDLSVHGGRRRERGARPRSRAPGR